MTSADRRSADEGLRLMLDLVDLQYDNEFAREIIKAQIQYVIALVAFASSGEIRAAMETLQTGTIIAERMMGLKS